ncbi:MAG: imidazoleglycerol-phosphate dehydratase HisB [Candidatus Bathyarchaeota archaeon]|jgi:imidazoleglycerol-phosphate dehydratase|nr:imidazoleglycerol-phosphate dehydratase HisB [Candidatus Bathyarchaeota archaeon]
MELRKVAGRRETAEVNISVQLNLDGRGIVNIDTGNRFLNHMLTTLAKHALVDLEVKASGDLKHHLSEDIALTVGDAINKALGDKRGIRRFGSALVPMDDSLARAAIDLGGRPYLSLDLKIQSSEIEDLKTEDIDHFFSSLVQSSESNIHLTVLYGTNDHHKVEAATKALALALKEACSPEPRILDMIPSTKGEL